MGDTNLTLQITVWEENYIVQDVQIENLRDHLILDAELRRGGLFTNGNFFYWTYPSAKCMLEKIRTMQDTRYTPSPTPNTSFEDIRIGPAQNGYSVTPPSEYEERHEERLNP